MAVILALLAITVLSFDCKWGEIMTDKIYTYDKTTGVVQFVSDVDAEFSYDNPNLESITLDGSAFEQWLQRTDPNQSLVIENGDVTLR